MNVKRDTVKIYDIQRPESIIDLGLQCEQGAWFSYREAEQNLEKLNGQRRSVNNHTQVKRITDKVGAVLALQNAISPAAREYAAPPAELIVQVDGGHMVNY